MGVTLSAFMRKPVTREYPEMHKALPERDRAFPLLLWDHEINEPFLLMHGGADDNPGTPTLQARRFLHALVGNGVNVRYVELPHERHHYRARENVLHTSAEMLDWLDRTIGPGSQAAPTAKSKAR